MRKKKRQFIVLILTMIFFISACSMTDSANDTEINSNKPQIVTSIFPVYEVVKEVAGDQADVHLMVGPSEDAHHYEPSAQAIALANEADAFIYSSDEMEFWAQDVISVLENEELRIIELAADLDLFIGDEYAHEEEEDDHGHDHTPGIDPHFWLDPVAVNEQLPIVVDLLAEIDPEGATIYQENGAIFSKTLSDLDSAYHEAFGGAKNRSFVVQHQAFGHLSNRYDLHQLSVGGLSTEVEPNPKELITVINFVEENNTEVIFYQSGNTSAVAETIANETNAEIAVLYDLENRPEGLEESGNLYIEAMYHNLDELQKVIY